MDSVELAGFQYHFMGFFFPKKKKTPMKMTRISYLNLKKDPLTWIVRIDKLFSLYLNYNLTGEARKNCGD